MKALFLTYLSNLTLGRSAALKTVSEALSANRRRAFLVSYDQRNGRYALTTHLALLGWSKTSPLWRQIDRAEAATLEDLTATIDPTIAAILGLSIKLAA